MRAWFIALLCIWLPLQGAWGNLHAAAAHDHAAPVIGLHGAGHAEAFSSASPVDPAHAECGHCHQGCSALPGEENGRQADASALPMPRGQHPAPASRPADLPERPQWAKPA